jgi:heme exporter protein A
MLEAVELECVRGDRRLFSGLNFGLEAGELLHLHGHNGSGKTTLLRVLCGLLLPSGGEVRWDGRSIRELREDYTAELTYIGHKNGIKGELTGVENLQIACRLDGVVVSEGQAWDTLEQMGLRGHEDLPAKTLSQGQRRRVALARLMLSKTRLWILDEPFVALDKMAVGHLQSVIRDQVARGGMVILTTHQEVSLTQGHLRQLQLGVGELGHA